MKILALIPARSGSKGILHKNIKLFKGKPLMAWSIDQAQQSKYINRIIVSTDNIKYQQIANEYGAETPFLRPCNISDDMSTDYDFIVHCLDWLNINEKYKPDMIIQLRPTYPIRKVTILDETIRIFIDNFNNYDSLRTVIPCEKSPYKMYTINNKQLIPLFNKIDKMQEPYNQCRQNLPFTYLHNGYIDIIKTETVLNNKSITGDKIYAYVMSKDEYHDIDSLNDWKEAEKININNS